MEAYGRVGVWAYRRIGKWTAFRTFRSQDRLPKAEDENDDEDENDWGSGGRELRPNIAGIVCIKAIDSLKLHVNCM